jgi:hypothetical protein
MFLLLRAEVIANQAVCPQCKNYARWQIDEPVPSAARAGLAATADDHADDDGSSEVMTVCCRKCSHRWRISW